MFAGLLSVAATGVYAPTAAGQSQEELQRARDQFREGLSLEAAGNWSAALARFQEVGRVKLTPQVRFHIARCHENLGRLNEALGEYRLAEYEASQARLPELEEITRSREQLEARIPSLVITRGPGAEAARIQLDGVDLGERQLGQRIAVDPGPHTIVARLPGDLAFQETVSLDERESKAVELVPPEGLLSGAKTPAGTSGSADSAERDPDARGASGKTVLPWVIGGVGAASLVGSGVFFLLRNGAASELSDTCRDNVCPQSLESTRDRGQLYSTLSMVTLGVGVVGVGVATYLLLTQGSRDAAAESASAWHFDVDASRSGGGVSVRGAF